MQALYKNKNKGYFSGGADSIDAIIYVGRISRHLKRECFRRFGDRNIKVLNS